MPKLELTMKSPELPQLLTKIEFALLKEPSVSDCVVRLRETETQDLELVAYVVSTGSFLPERLQSHLQGLVPENLLPIAFVPVSTLPLTSTGEVDEPMLARLAVIDADLVQRWEGQLQSQAEIEQAAVVVQEYTEKIPPLHLSDVLPNWKVANSSVLHPTRIVSQSSTEKSDSISISHGEPLQLSADAPKTLPEVLLTAARVGSDRGIIYIHSDGSETIQSYQALLAEAQQILAGLRKLGLQPQDKVIFQLDQNQDFIPAFWACILGGFVPVPISTAPTYEPSNSTVGKLCNSWQILGRPIILTSERLAPAIHLLSEPLQLENLRVATVDDLRLGEKADPNCHESLPDDLALLLLTSGSTGMPKGVMLTHENLVSNVASSAQMNKLQREDICLNWLNLDHVGSLVRCCIRDIYVGSQQIHAPVAAFLENPLKWLDWIDRYRVTFAWAPNFALGLINEHSVAINQGRWDLSCLKSVLSVAEPIVPKTAKRFLELLTPHGLSMNAMHSAWGMSETGAAVVFSHRYLLNLPSDDYPFVEVGAPVPNFSVRIVDAQEQVVQEGTVGRVQICGPMVIDRYYENPELNREAFTPDGWLRTGDLGLLREGHLTITGREKDIIIINGLNHYSNEIEAVVQEVEGVVPSYTAACGIRESGKDTDQLVIFFHTSVCEDDWVGLLEDIRGSVVRQIGVSPAYLVPVEKAAIPKSSIGKIQRSQLKERFVAGEFDPIIKQVDILLGNNNTLPDWFYRRIWCRKEAVTLTTQPVTGLSLVLLDQLGLGRRLCEELDQLNTPYLAVEAGSDFAKLGANRYSIDPNNPKHYRRLFESLKAANLQIDQILHLWTYREYEGEVSTLEALEQAQEYGVYSLLFLIQALSQVQGSRANVRLSVISSYTQPTKPEDEIAYEKTPLLGLIKTIPQEMPGLDCRHLDLSTEEGDANVAYVLRELQVIQKEQEVAYRDGLRLVPRLEKVDLRQEQKQELPFKHGGMYLLSGGLGEIGVEIARYLLQHYQARLLLVGRTPLPQRSKWSEHLRQDDAVSKRIQAYLSLEQLGGEVIYEAVDICDLTHLQQVVDQASSCWQCSLDGVIHLAGIGQERLLVEETPDTFATTLRAKVLGTWVLHQLVKPQPECLFISVSSVISFFGMINVGAYAAANSFLDGFWHYQRYKSGLESYCFGSSTWAGVGISRGYEYRDSHLAQGREVMSVEQGLNSLLASLRHEPAHLLVGLNGTNPHVRCHMQTESRCVQKLSAYFTAQAEQISVARLQELEVRDRFGTVSSCDFFQVQQMPLTDTGEIERQQLAVTGLRAAAQRVAPTTELEHQLANIWQEVLGVPQVGIHDNFFEIGGHSLLGTQVISRIRDACSVELTLSSLFETPTVAGLAVAITQGSDAAKEQTIPRRANRDSAPLSFAQQRMWFLDQLEGENPAYNIARAVRLVGSLQVAALEQSLNEIIRRHETLRTTFTAVDGQPFQVIAPILTLTLSVVDLTQLPETQRSAEAERLTIQEAQRPFDLTSGSLLRAQLLRLAPQEHWFLLTIHHIVSDGWSSGVFMKELAALYEAFCSGKPSPLPELPIQYADFAHWQRQWLQGEVVQQLLNYWKQLLGGSLPMLELPTDRPRPAVQTHQGAKHSLRLSKELSEALKALSRREEATLFMTLLAAFQTLLYRYCGQEDIIVGSPIAGRNRAEIEELIGCFLNSLAMRTNLSGNPSFRELLGRVREVALKAYANQDLPVEKLIEELQLERDLSQNRLFQVLFILQNTPMPILELSGLTLSSLAIDNKTAKFDLTLELQETPLGISGWFEYNTDLFDETTLVRMVGHFQTLLEGIVANPEQKLSDLPVLTPAERQTLLVKWNNTQADYPKDLCIHQLFETQVKLTPEAIAVVFEDKQLNYWELNCRANQLANYLRSLGVKPEVFVGLYIDRSLEMVVGLLAILKAGGAYVPLDPAYPKERLAHMLSDSQVSVLLTQEQLLPRLPEQQAHVVCLDTDWGRIGQETQENPLCNVSPENLAYVIYTSGSTGKPKGVMIQHQSLVSFTQTTTVKYGISGSDRVLQFASISFDAAAEEIYPCLTSGGTLVLRTDEMLSDLQTFLQKCRDWKLTVLDLPTAYWHQVTSELAMTDLVLPESLRLVIIGGERALPERVQLWQKVVGTHPQLVNTYGPTEATVVATMYKLPTSTLEDTALSEVPIGRTLSHVQAYVLDKYLKPVPIGVPGELHIGGISLARGYLNRPDLTAEKFIPNPFHDQPGTRLYKTGDLVRYLPDGNIEYLGRIDNQVKIRGFRIELGEIEAVLGQHPAIRETLVVVREDVPGDKRLVAYVIPKQEPALTISELRHFLKEQLPNYMIPSAFVMLETIPLTPNGKVDYLALPAPEMAQLELEETFVAPRTPVEKQLASIWADVLKLEQVGVYNSFFDLGGHSLLGMQVMSRLCQAFGVELPVRSLFEAPTVAELAKQIDTLLWATQQNLAAHSSTTEDDLEEIEL
jgi:amino acid adenylation domain-containing protein